MLDICVYLVWAVYEQVCVAACDCGHLKLAKVLSVCGHCSHFLIILHL